MHPPKYMEFVMGHSLWFKRPLIAGTPDQRNPGEGQAQAESGPGVTSQFETGDRVRHHTFGEGVVIESRATKTDEEVAVAFEGVGIKHLLASFADLELLEPRALPNTPPYPF